MGYRSDVRILTSKKGFAELNKYVNNYLKDKNEYNLMENIQYKKENDFCCYFGWNWVKWYEHDYDSVTAIMNGLEHLKENEYSYRYARIGENYDDYDEHYYESEKEEEQDLEFPNIIREFDDDYVSANIEKCNSDIELDNG